MTLYNQHSYPHVPYPSPTLPDATVKSGGCGPCCAATILSFFSVDMPPEKLAPEFVRLGIRVKGGTDMNAAARYIRDKAGVEFTTTSDEAVLAAHLKAGGVAIANVDGNAGEKGIFSSEGHYICVVGIKPNGDLMIFDVGDYSTKYSAPNYAWRAAYVTREGKLLICTQATLNIDTKHRTPNYYLFKRKDEDMLTDKQFDEMMEAWAKRQLAKTEDDWSVKEGHFAKAKALGIVSGSPKEVVRKDVLVAMLGRLGLLK